MANYFVTGVDNQEYGPVSTEDLRKWIAEGRVDAVSKVRLEGTTEWIPVSTVPELAGVTKTAAPPPFSANTPASVGKISALAITSLVLGVLGLFTCGTTALIGLILGIIALVKVSNSQGALRGKGLAISGIVVSGVFIFMIPIFMALFLPALAAAKGKAQQINCMNNEKQLALAVLVYSQGKGNHLPPAATWCDAIQANAGSDKLFKCPAADATSRCDYAFNAKLDGLDLGKVNPETVLIFESDAGWNAHGGSEMLVQRHRVHFTVVAFVDGHTEVVSDARLQSLRWNP
jgi:hypothetical protein